MGNKGKSNVNRALLHLGRSVSPLTIVNDTDHVEMGTTLEEELQTKGGRLKVAFVIAVPILLIALIIAGTIFLIR